MSPRNTLLLGVLLLIGAQALASFALTPLRGQQAAHHEVYGSLKPGEFAGTLMLGGFRGLACDLLWMRAQNAKDSGRFYESVALSQTIVRIQPRFEQIWEYLTWDMAYNIAAEVEDPQSKWSWFIAGITVNIEGARRNPQSERLMRHLAWMFQHKGDSFRDEIEKANLSSLLNPLLDDLNATLPADQQLERIANEPGTGNFQFSERLYRATMYLAERNNQRLPPFVRRMIPIAIERDGNRLRNRGEHFAALKRYLTSLQDWYRARSWSDKKVADGDDGFDQQMNSEMCEHNIGRLTRKIILLAEQLSTDANAHQRFANAVNGQQWEAATQVLGENNWKLAVTTGRIRWLDEQ